MADGRVTIKTNVDDKSLKDLRSSLKELESAFKALQSVDPFSGISKDARDLMNEFTGVSSSASKVEQDIDSIDGDSMDDVSKKASDAGSSLDGTAQSADKADASIDDIDGKSMEDVTKKAGDASDGLDDTATSASKADASIENVDGKSLDNVSKQADKAGKSIDQADKDVNRFSFSLKDVAKSAVVISAVSKTFDILVASLDDAISRFDTLNTFPRTMNLLGYETAVVDRSTRSLVRGIEGLPTKLDDIIQTTQRLGGMTGDLDDATETALALNNAFLASGSSAMDATRGTEQYIQMLGNGKVDMQSWRTLTETMNYALIQAANSFGYTGPSALMQFYNALQSGDVTFDQFNKKMQELNKAQGGFAELALTNSEGIATSWANIKTAISRNVANIITVIDDMVESITGKNIAQNLNNFKFVIDDVFGFAITILRGTTPVVEGLWKAFKLLLDILRPLEPALWGIVSAFVAFKIIKTVEGMWIGLTTAVGLARVAMQLFGATALATGNGMLTLTGIKAGLSAVLGNVALNAGVATGAMGTLAGGVTVLKGAITALSGPIGWAVAGIGLLVTAGVGIYKVFIKASDETQALGKALKDTAAETSELNDLVDQTASSYGKTKEATEAQFEAVRELAIQTAELANQEKIGVADKKILKDNIDELNDSVEGLNLTYSEEEGRLLSTNDAMLERINMAAEDAKYNDARERSKEIQEQHAEATALLTENEKALAEAQEHLDGLAWYQSSGEAKEGVEQLKEENERLVEQIGVLGEEQLKIDEEMKASAESLAEAEAVVNQERISSLEQLSDKQREVAESIRSEYQSLVDKARDWSNAIETEYTKTNEAGEEYVVSSREAFNDAKATLEQNVEAMREWSDSMGELAERGVDAGLLEQLRAMGPEGLPLVQGFVDASDEELSEMESLFGESAELSKDALMNGLAIEDGAMIDGAEDLIFNTGEAMVSAVESSGLAKIIPDEVSKSKEDMEKAGEDVARGVTAGIERGSKGAKDASKQMAKDVNTGFTAELMIQSPSVVFLRHGQDIGEGLTLGIKSSGTKVLNAMKILGNELDRIMRQSMTTQNKNVQTGYTAIVNTIRTNMNRVPPLVQNTMNRSTQSMRNASSQSHTAGRMLGLGFYNGLNSTAGSIYSLATTIARNAVSRINNALKVRSPSREGFASGDFLGQGLWLGMKHQVRNVEKWSDKLGQSALLGMLKPEPLGMSPQFTPAMVGGYSGTTDSRTIHHDNGVAIHIENIENYSDSDIPRILEESAWIIGRERSRLDD